MRKIEYAVYLISYDVIQLCITSNYKEALEAWYQYQASNPHRFAIYALNQESVGKFYRSIIMNQAYLRKLNNRYQVDYNWKELIRESIKNFIKKNYKLYNGIYLLEPFGSILDLVEP